MKGVLQLDEVDGLVIAREEDDTLIFAVHSGAVEPHEMAAGSVPRQKRNTFDESALARLTAIVVELHFQTEVREAAELHAGREHAGIADRAIEGGDVDALDVRNIDPNEAP